MWKLYGNKRKNEIVFQDPGEGAAIALRKAQAWTPERANLTHGQPTTAACGRRREEGCTLEREMNANEVKRESAARRGLVSERKVTVMQRPNVRGTEQLQIKNEKPIKERMPDAQTRRERVFYALLIMAGFIMIATASRNLLARDREYSSARSEYEQLRELYPVLPAYPATVDPEASTSDNLESTSTPLNDSELPILVHNNFTLPDLDSKPRLSPSENSSQQIPHISFPSPTRNSAFSIHRSALSASSIDNFSYSPPSDSIASLTELNPDFIGWIVIIGTGIDYPVVRGSDNNQYLNATFSGRNNPSGAIFMDTRNTRGFDSAFCVLYGHNMRDGSMFAPLNWYLDSAFMTAHPDIIITTADGEALVYNIFKAVSINTSDDAHDLYIPEKIADDVAESAPGGASRFLLLSTCANSSNKDERTLVYAALAG